MTISTVPTAATPLGAEGPRAPARSVTTIAFGRGPWVAVVAAITLLGCGDAGRGLGEPCDTTGECSSELQCLDQLCVPRCLGFVDCGDGAVCDDGECRLVTSAIGDECSSELSCGAGQTCRLPEDFNSEPSCQAETLGPLEGERCTDDTGCRSGVCALGRCIHLCARTTDCRRGWTCAKIPGPPQDFDGCLPGNATIEFDVEVKTPTTLPPTPQSRVVEVWVPVPSTARSMVLLFEARAADQFVGASALDGPRRQILYRRPFDIAAYFRNPVRHIPMPEVSVMQVPSSTSAPLEGGVYSVAVTRFRLSSLPGGGQQEEPATGPHPRLRVIQKLGSGARLDLHFYFRDLADHPCAARFGGLLNAATAQTLPGFQTAYLKGIREVFSPANIHLGEITYSDHDRGLPGPRPEFDVLDAADAPSLFALSRHQGGIAIFFVRSISPDGPQILTGGTPGAPVAGTGASGIAISADTLCYRDWSQLARQTAHGIARHMGLFRNVEPDDADHVDPIDDSPSDALNLMHWTESGGTALSFGQREVLRASPVLR